MPSVVPVHHDEASLRKYFGIAKRRAWVIIFVLVSVSLAALFFTLRQPPLYEASAEVLLNQETLASSLSDIQDPATLQDPNRIAATQTELARVTPLAKREIGRA